MQPQLELNAEPFPRVDFYNLLASERGVAKGWRWFDLKVLGDHKSPREQTSFQIRGAVYLGETRTGRGKWDKATTREFVISFTEYDARVERWQIETGRCGWCFGSGSESLGSSGTRTCSRCAGTGKPPAAATP